MSTFTPPARSTAVPPILPVNGPDQSPLAARLFRHYRGRPEGINVYLLSDGTITETDPDSESVFWQQSQGPLGCVYVVTAWYGGHDDYELTAYEAALLESNGYTITGTPTPPTEDPPTITSLSPSSGVSETTVTVIGTNMSEVTMATFDTDTLLNVSIISATRVSIEIPIVVDGNYGVTVINPYGESNTVTFTVETPVPGAPPVITSVSPASGNAGTVLAITGTSFDTATSVLVGANAASFSVNSSSLINATAPAHADGAVAVVVTTQFGVSNSGTFTYTTAAPSDPHPGADILLEDGSYLLQEDSASSLLQES